MQDTFQWTDELVLEFANRRNELMVHDYQLEQFKSSKSPKKEWEIVAFRERCGIGIYKLREDGRYRNDDFLDMQGFSLNAMLEDKDVIISVRRLSDASEWQVKETVEIWDTGRFIIEAFEVCAGQMLVKTNGGTFLLGALQKLPQPILTTVDGVEIYEGMKYWPVSKDTFNIYTVNIAREVDRGKWGGAYLFSTHQAAEAYILNNRPLLSLSDVRKVIAQLEYVRHASDAIQELTALVKQKLNQ